jgi:hypothetical protein
MDELIIEGVRCFRERQEVPLRPITLLVGENSTGKTTFLAMARLAWDACKAYPPLDFNDAPFPLGAFDDMVSRRRNAGRSEPYFVVGLRYWTGPRGKTLDPSRSSGAQLPDAITALSRFAAEGPQPEMRSWRFEAGPLSLQMEFGEKKGAPTLVFAAPTGKARLPNPNYPRGVPPVMVFGSPDFYFAGRDSSLGRYETRGSRPTPEDMQALNDSGSVLQRRLGARPYAFAPIRTRPRRTYDPVGEAPEPEGGHVPMVMASVSSVDPKGWERLRASLASFGSASGLFRDVQIRRKGRSASEPFQVTVKVAGSAFNLVDVGYGVSQVLPIIVDSLRGDRGRTYLLQQPEVHLHPKAQAELGSFLAFLAKEQNKQFLVETHSDHLVDRVRMDVREGKHGLTPRDVSLLYFERKKGNATIHPLELDGAGNILNPPRGYRKFFLDEQWRLIRG